MTGEKRVLPLVIATTGHRDLVSGELAGIRALVRGLFVNLIEQYPDLRLLVMSPLAEGADLLVAEVAVELEIELVVPLPMPKDLYMRDFTTAESRAQFETLCERAKEVFELPLASGVSSKQIENLGSDRNRQYAQLGVFLSAHCHILLALWDGKQAKNSAARGRWSTFTMTI